VSIEGKLRWSQWERDGSKRSKIEVIVDEIEFMSRQGDSNGQNQPQNQQTNNYSNQYQNGPNYGSQGPQGGYQQAPQQQGYYDSDCPF
jgi:single-strand DNA-binding protein